MKTQWLSGMIGILFAASVCVAFPEPSVIGGKNIWTLDVQYEQPQQITMTLPGDNQPKRFWYIILTLTNNSTQNSVPFFPKCTLMTDTFKLVEAGRGTMNIVFEKIKLKHQGGYPFLELFDQTEHKILHGQDNSRDIVIIWPDFDENAKKVSLMISGLSNETVMVHHPIEKDSSGNPKELYLTKSLALEYGIGGDPSLRAMASMKYLNKKWIMW